MEISDLDKVLRITANRYIVTLAVTKRAEEIYDTATLLTRKLNPISIAIKELAEGKLKIKPVELIEE
ncbi:MAG: DNA-directed RNA polymerase subunit omega [bacterium]|nr:DNA-directed RNA polymerase subunit omega [bacterium]